MFRMSSRLGEEIASQVLANEIVIRNVRIQCSDHIVPILVGIGYDKVTLMSPRFRIAHEVEPMSRPSLSKTRGAQQFADDPLAGRVGGVLDKRFELADRRR